MRSTRKSIPIRFPRAIPRKKITRKKMAHLIVRRLEHYLPPKNLQQALANGWTIDEQLSWWEFHGGNKRTGFLFLKKKSAGGERLILSFTALYDVGRPHFLGERP